ncbi:MAG: dTDP-4-dehydrorhamnose 3,5-epimerase [Paenibacillaceae bacterium]|jgi:dTDP-4-dehydrorhamnose 3,5-epimerase|nr:dTDP-4-dehydrorhamnose 3,5-epimerase [Paenibacillaceae bacterium]
MQIINQSPSGFILAEAVCRKDPRGSFAETFQQARWEELGVRTLFKQDNISVSKEAGTLRGLHYQLNPAAQAKLIRVTAGAIYDVIVDIRQGSPTFGSWYGFILTSRNYRQLLVPRGFAHGFCTLVPDTEVFYKVDGYYSPEHDRGIIWNDPALGIDWPVSEPVLSDKDRNHPPLAQADNNFVWEDSTP